LVENHVRLLGVLNIVIGALTGVFALVQFLFFGGPMTISTWLALNSGVVAVWLWAMLSLMIPSIVVGIALSGFRPWSRTAGIVLSIFELLNLPLGTAVALYGLWLLFSDEADMIFTQRFGQYMIGRR